MELEHLQKTFQIVCSSIIAIKVRLIQETRNQIKKNLLHILNMQGTGISSTRTLNIDRERDLQKMSMLMAVLIQVTLP